MRGKEIGAIAIAIAVIIALIFAFSQFADWYFGEKGYKFSQVPRGNFVYSDYIREVRFECTDYYIGDVDASYELYIDKVLIHSGIIDWESGKKDGMFSTREKSESGEFDIHFINNNKVKIYNITNAEILEALKGLTVLILTRE